MAPGIRRLGLLALAALAAGGCSSAVPRRTAAPAVGNPPAVGNQGGAWDLVLAGPVDAGPGPETSRRNASLQWAAADSRLTRDLASPYGPPTLGRSRRVYIHRDPYGYTYYLGWPEPARR